MKRFFLALFLAFGLSEVTAQVTDADSLLAGLDTKAEQNQLLPEKMILSQRIFWGQNGLLRKAHIAPALTPENRAKELKVRRTMLKLHQAMGIITAAGMLAQGILGARLYNATGDNYARIKSAHEAMATGINIAYGTTALMAFTAPPGMLNRKGISNMKVHRYLSYIHLTGMITTNILADKIGDNYKLKPYHRAAAYTTFGAYFAAMAVLKFEF
ncbi:hypothetical protein [Emticicia fluvialis]|uniref:hypothetical protein n=1 Tax=Emticicia fluvialis TaxID=2974474 RepID=UPI0021660EA7|nr:hypothetical protein [Emticicia fluvialis]